MVFSSYFIEEIVARMQLSCDVFGVCVSVINAVMWVLCIYVAEIKMKILRTQRKHAYKLTIWGEYASAFPHKQ